MQILFFWKKKDFNNKILFHKKSDANRESTVKVSAIASFFAVLFARKRPDNAKVYWSPSSS